MGNSAGCCVEDRSNVKTTMLEQKCAEMKKQGNYPRLTPRDDWNNEKYDAFARLNELSKNGEITRDQFLEALSNANLAGLDVAEFAKAEEAAVRAAMRKKARASLAQAMSTREEVSLRLALNMADEAALDTQETWAAVELIEKLEANVGPEGAGQVRRSRAVEHLHRALDTRTRSELQEAIREAEEVGLGSKNDRALLAQARVTLRMVSARQLAAKERRSCENDPISPRTMAEISS